MHTVDHYPGAEDELSMEDNNTSAFNCRLLPSGRGWALHAYGRAIDVNPLINPFIDSSGDIQPKTAGPYLDRNRTDPGILHAGDPAVRTPSPIAGGAGAATGEPRRTTSISSAASESTVPARVAADG